MTPGDNIVNIEVKLGFDRIRNSISERCTTEGGRAMLLGERFTTDPAVVSARLKVCDQLRQVMMMQTGFPTGEYDDIHPLLAKAAVEGTFLEAPEVLVLQRGLGLARELILYLDSLDSKVYGELTSVAFGVGYFPEIHRRIEMIVDRFGNVKDNASPELNSIRRSIREREGQVSKRLQKILSEARGAGLVDAEAGISIREGRSVIPVSAANKRKIKGFVHDESATGKTVFIEPAEIVELNNELRELESSEKREIVRILSEFTDGIRIDVDELEKTARFIVTMDMIRAKARYALAHNCVMPLLSDEGILEIRQGRHPLLEEALGREGRQIVPLYLQLNREKHILIISGPNAGGKSVCLKTVGLLQLMLQHGVPLPCLENSQFPIFNNIYVDIGDEQSLENDLSTYSSHLLNMKRMVQSADKESLVLIDEFGTGTEPVIGGAIAEAILEKLENKGVYGVITTHYSNLKYYASNAVGVANGAMTFDVSNIRPLFKLEMGMPGSSFAVEIARKIGLPEDIIKSASEKVGSEQMSLERQLREVARDKRYWQQKRERIRIADRKVEELESRYAQQLASIKELRREVLEKAKTEAGKITAEANREIENAIKTIRETQADKDKTRIVRKRIDDMREHLLEDDLSDEKISTEMEKIMRRQKKRSESKKNRPEKSSARPNQPDKPAVPVVGSKVKMQEGDMIGEVQIIKGKKASVAFGQILTMVALDKLTVVSNAEFKNQSKRTTPTIIVSDDISKRKTGFRHSIDVRGMRAAEALVKVEEFIDDAVMVGAAEVTILHGKGTGALKEEIRRFLRFYDQVKSASDEHADRGGSGITVVKLFT